MIYSRGALYDAKGKELVREIEHGRIANPLSFPYPSLHCWALREEVGSFFVSFLNI